MALNLKITATEQKNSFIVYDCTGNYNGENKGGWGIPNQRIEDVEDAYLEIYPPNHPEGAEPIKIVTYPDFPNTEVLGFEILPYMVGMTSEIKSGEYKIRLVVSGTDKKGVAFKKSTILSVVFTRSVECCVDHLLKRVGPDAFKSEAQKKIIELSNLLESVKYNVDCGLNTKANDIIQYLAAQCECCGC